MARKKKGNRGPFAAVERALLKSDEWRDLTPMARLVMIEFVASFNGSRLKVAYSDAPCNPRTFSRCIKELKREKWLELDQPGGLIGHKTSVYRLGHKGAKWWPEIYYAK